MDFRIQKFNNTLKKIIGESISNLDELASEVSMISIMSVDTSKDFSFSKVYVSIYNPSNEYIDQIIENLNDKAFYFQKIISSKVRTSRTPKIKFFLDKSSEFQKQIDELINEVSSEK